MILNNNDHSEPLLEIIKPYTSNKHGHVKKLHFGKWRKRLTLQMSALIASQIIIGTTAFAHNSVSFTDIAVKDGVGIDYLHTQSPREALLDTIKTGPLTFPELSSIPLGPRGTAGAALLDFDRDGDLDIYVTNGPGTSNSLYANQFKQTGNVTFIDVANSAQVGVTSRESVGVCYGDIDNDGDLDLYVLNLADENVLFENQGNGTFEDISISSHTGAGGSHYPSSCSMGDVNGDGLLDIAIANTVGTWDNRIAFREVPFALNDHNQLLLNTGDNQFKDVSMTSGIQKLNGFPAYASGAAGITWAIAIVDYDLDGDADIIMADDQGPFPPAVIGGIDRGLLHIMNNDGTGHFRDVNVELGLNISGAWMGISFGDINADGRMDLFSTNVGDYMVADVGLIPGAPNPFPLGSIASRSFVHQADGTFADQGAGDLVSTMFGWGTVMLDYDNDGDTDITYGGGLDFATIYETAPRVLLKNDGAGNFAYDLQAFADSTDHIRRNTKGIIRGDLNGDGFVDLVSVSSFDIDAELTPHTTKWGVEIDQLAFYLRIFEPISPTEFGWTGNGAVDGSLSIELNSGNDNHWVAIDLLGTKDLVEHGRVNRDGIGAVVSFTPKHGKTAMVPIIGGDSHASQNSLTAHFGLGEADKGIVDILWPGGVRNRFYGLRASEQIMLPEIPCSFDAKWSRDDYSHCVKEALKELREEGIITRKLASRLKRSAMRAFKKSQMHEREEHEDREEGEDGEDEHDD